MYDDSPLTLPENDGWSISRPKIKINEVLIRLRHLRDLWSLYCARSSVRAFPAGRDRDNRCPETRHMFRRNCTDYYRTPTARKTALSSRSGICTSIGSRTSPLRRKRQRWCRFPNRDARKASPRTFRRSDKDSISKPMSRTRLCRNHRWHPWRRIKLGSRVKSFRD